MDICYANNFEDLNRSLESQGWAIAQSAFFGGSVRNAVAKIGNFLGDIRNLGEPKPIWEVKVRGTEGSFSETNAAGYYHTDCQYAQPTPRYLVLGCQIPAIDGGDTKLINFNARRIQLLMDELGASFRERLMSERWCWRVPNVLRRYVDYEVSRPAPILAFDGKIRWKLSSLVTDTVEDQKCAEVFEDWLDNTEPDLLYRLQADEILVSDNHRTVHGRTAFGDAGRLMLRARVREYS